MSQRQQVPRAKPPRRMGGPSGRPEKSPAPSYASPPWSELEKHLLDRVADLWPDMGPWLQEFFRDLTVTGGHRPLTNQGAIRKVVALDPQKSDWLILEVLRQCYQASVNRDKGDQYREARKRSRDYIQNRQDVKAAVTMIRSVLDAYPKESALDLWRANRIMKQRAPVLMGTPRPSSPSPILSYDQLFKSLEEAFSAAPVGSTKAGWGLDAGPFVHRYYAGPLIYQKALEQKAQPDAALNGLLFSLAFHFRRATSGQQDTPWMTGAEMPKHGRPQLSLVVYFAQAIFPRNPLSPSKVKKRLEHLCEHHVGLANWPH